MTGANPCVFGDDEQTIYQWRGSDISNIVDSAGRYPDVEQARLNENFRSSEAIIKSDRQVAERNAERLANAWSPSMHSPGPSPKATCSLSDFEILLQEAQWIAQQI